MEKKNNLVSFMQAYLISLGGINELMGIILNREEGIMIMNLIPLAGLIALHFVASDKKNQLNMNKKALLFVYYIMSVIIIYKYACRKTTLEYEEVLVYVLIPIYLSFYKIDTEKLLKYMIAFSVLIVPFSGGIFNVVGSYKSSVGVAEAIGMSTTYNMLPFIVAAILHFWYYRKNVGFLMWIGYGINVYYLIMAIMYGSRGAIVTLMALVVLIWLHKFSADGKMKENKTRTVIITALVGMAVILLVYNFETTLLSVHNWLRSMDIEITAITKSVQKLGEGNLSNGRDYIFEFTFNGIKENMFIGNGIASMFHRSYYTIAYPHNIFLQFLYDLGIFVSIPLSVLTIRAFIVTLFKSPVSKGYAVILILLFSVSIPRLCYSAEFWTNIPFWFLIMYTISPNIYKEETEILCEENEAEPNFL